MFKAFVSKSHPEFSSNRQQDAQEFFLHLVNLVEVSLEDIPQKCTSFSTDGVTKYPFSLHQSLMGPLGGCLCWHLMRLPLTFGFQMLLALYGFHSVCVIGVPGLCTEPPESPSRSLISSHYHSGDHAAGAPELNPMEAMKNSP